MPRNAANIATWDDLRDELDRWEAAGRMVTLWWRDDDAVTATAALSELLSLADGVPLGLAVIPAATRPDLAAALCGVGSVTVLQHGWLHTDRAATGKKSEYPEDRVAGAAIAEIAAGRARLCSLFGSQAAPIFVPPWNRIARHLIPLLPNAGIAALSAMASPGTVRVPPGLAALHVHVDLTAWKGDRGFIGTETALGMLIGNLRRGGEASRRSDPIGLLTHHLVMDRATVDFMRRLLDITTARRAVRWLSPPELIA